MGIIFFIGVLLYFLYGLEKSHKPKKNIFNKKIDRTIDTLRFIRHFSIDIEPLINIITINGSPVYFNTKNAWGNEVVADIFTQIEDDIISIQTQHNKIYTASINQTLDTLSFHYFMSNKLIWQKKLKAKTSSSYCLLHAPYFYFLSEGIYDYYLLRYNFVQETFEDTISFNDVFSPIDYVPSDLTMHGELFIMKNDKLCYKSGISSWGFITFGSTIKRIRTIDSLPFPKLKETEIAPDIIETKAAPDIYVSKDVKFINNTIYNLSLFDNAGENNAYLDVYHDDFYYGNSFFVPRSTGGHLASHFTICKDSIYVGYYGGKEIGVYVF